MPRKWQRHLVVTFMVTSNIALASSSGFDRSHVEARPSNYKEYAAVEEPLSVTDKVSDTVVRYMSRNVTI